MRLIDADALRKEFPENYEKPLWHFTGIWAVIDVAETVDPVKHGHWIPENRYIYGGDIVRRFGKCSICNNLTTECKKYLYCPNCGAKMDEEATNDGI